MLYIHKRQIKQQNGPTLSLNSGPLYGLKQCQNTSKMYSDLIQINKKKYINDPTETLCNTGLHCAFFFRGRLPLTG